MPRRAAEMDQLHEGLQKPMVPAAERISLLLQVSWPINDH